MTQPLVDFAAAKEAPVPPGHFLLGNLPAILDEESRIDTHLRFRREFGDLVKARYGPRYEYTGYHPDIFKRVLVDQNKIYAKSADYQVLAMFIGQGLVTSEGETWMRQRRLIQP